MIAEFMTKLEDMAKATSERQTLQPKAEPEYCYLLKQADGSWAIQDAQPHSRQHVASSVKSLVDFSDAYKLSEKMRVVIWYSRESVVSVLTDNAGRRDIVTMPVGLSPQVKQLLSIEQTRKPWKQSELILMLRTTFAGCLGPAGELLTILRRLRFANSVAASAEIQQGRRSVGKQIESEVTGTAAIPETFQLDVPIFAARTLPQWTGLVTIALEPDPATETFQLIPLPLEIESAIAGAESKLGTLLFSEVQATETKDIPVYFGKP